MAKFLLTGSVEYSADELEGTASVELQEFLRKVESESPFERTAADPLLRLPLFDAARLARQEEDAEMIAQRQ